ncbi:SpoIIE family protein phosphatase [Flammeovirga aprica]|uniref:SpoIIE family protein phosphatase n=1 Tax=Flammeovirga aprica JL-4 TaxID=694437 RepID=A0A7X9RUF8_9BACT|nr:SpoIIE family protein phosphatase [Flammeovirga aprica]NME68910.1 SpoIIE family protein phosphatase [Flammeovirga aprica JL-4]
MNSTLNAQLLYGNRIELNKEKSFWRKAKYSFLFFIFFTLAGFFKLQFFQSGLLAFSGMLVLFTIYMLRKRVKWKTLCTVYLYFLTTMLFFLSLAAGGMKAHSSAWIATTIVTAYWFLGKKRSRFILVYSAVLLTLLFVIELVNDGPLFDPLSSTNQVLFNWLLDLALLLNISNDVRAMDLQTTIFQNKLQKNSDELIQFGEELSQTNEEINAQKEEIESQRDDIEKSHLKLRKSLDHVTDSIRYAKTIQMALLTSQEELNKIFKEVSILFKPKDHVSGDFYFSRKFDNRTLMVVGDCTGHGVPGALLSMVALEALDRLEELPESPADLLEALDTYFFEKLRQSNVDGNKDGMDISVAYIDYDYRFQYAGAKGKGLLVDNTGVVPLKATNRSIGGNIKKSKAFEVTEIQIQPDTLICLYTDGFVDQNGINGKIGSLRFRNILEKYYLKFTKDCVEELEVVLNNETYGFTQRDDITVFVAIHH